jgi:hypothetical protein
VLSEQGADLMASREHMMTVPPDQLSEAQLEHARKLLEWSDSLEDPPFSTWEAFQQEREEQ